MVLVIQTQLLADPDRPETAWRADLDLSHVALLAPIPSIVYSDIAALCKPSTIYSLNALKLTSLSAASQAKTAKAATF